MSGSDGDATLTLVVNPTAGRGRAGKALPKVTSELLTALPDVHVRALVAHDYAEAQEHCRDAVDRAQQRGTAKVDRLVVMGGDGMAHLGVNACAETGMLLGVIPAGTGNDFCRGVGIPARIDDAVRAIVDGRTRTIDLIEVEGALDDGSARAWVGCIVSTGFDSRVGIRAGSVRLPLGPLSYACAALAELATFTPLSYRLRIDGVARDLSAMLVCVGNTAIFGGGMQGCPNADPTDGELDLTIVHPVSRGTLLRLLPSLFTGGFVKHPAVELLRARTVEVDGDGLYGSGDGETLGPVPLRLTSRAGVLDVLVP